MMKFALMTRFSEGQEFVDEEDPEYSVEIFSAKDVNSAKERAKKQWDKWDGEEGIHEMLLLTVSEVEEISFEDPVKAEKRKLEATVAKLQDDYKALKAELDDRNASSYELLQMVKELSGRDPILEAKKVKGDISTVAKNLLYEAVRTKVKEEVEKLKGTQSK
jgi:NTP pyrophosphatase (non-canonical NTP hydrolase)